MGTKRFEDEWEKISEHREKSRYLAQFLVSAESCPMDPPEERFSAKMSKSIPRRGDDVIPALPWWDALALLGGGTAVSAAGAASVIPHVSDPTPAASAVGSVGLHRATRSARAAPDVELSTGNAGKLQLASAPYFLPLTVTVIDGFDGRPRPFEATCPWLGCPAPEWPMPSAWLLVIDDVISRADRVMPPR